MKCLFWPYHLLIEFEFTLSIGRQTTFLCTYNTDTAYHCFAAMEPFRAAVFLFLLTAGSVTHLEARLFDCVQYRHCQCTEQAISCVRSGIHRVPIFSPFLVSL